jgi:2'-deoxynucleoside 5'-phosphate N-hydrolase
MKVYCAAPIRGNTDHKRWSDQIPYFVESYGAEPLTEASLFASGSFRDDEIFERDLRWLEESDCVIAEVSSPSTGIGFEIAYALYCLQIPVLALYNKETSGRVSAMILGCSSPRLKIAAYSDIKEMQVHIQEFLKPIRKNIEREGI